MQDNEFEWDDAKAAANVVRHGVSFKTAQLAFADAFAVESADLRENHGEHRYVLLGMVKNRILHVAYTIRNERVRIISARPAEPRERRRYHEENG